MIEILLVSYIAGGLGAMGGFFMGRFDAQVGRMGPASALLMCLWPLSVGAILLGVLTRATRKLTRKMSLCTKSLKS